MRQETQKIMSAFLRGESASAQRTNTDGHNVWLHGNLIAQRSEGDYVDFTDRVPRGTSESGEIFYE